MRPGHPVVSRLTSMHGIDRPEGPPYRDRSDAGRRLAAKLQDYSGRPDVVVLALPRGGVPVAYEVAGALGAPLDVFIVRKLGLPTHPELAMGAIASGGIRVLDEKVVRHFGVSHEELAAVTAAEERELERREREYRDGRPRPDVGGKTVILIDDGLATGATMAAAAAALHAQGPAKLVVAVPVSSPETCAAFRDIVDDVVCAITPEPFYAVGLWYQNFSQTTDGEVRDLLARAAEERPGTPSGRVNRDARMEQAVTGKQQLADRTMRFSDGRVTLEGTIAVPPVPRGVVIFAHGSSSDRHSPRNRFVAAELQRNGLGTFLVDLLTEEEAAIDIRTRHLRFEIALLAERIVGAIDWLGGQPETRDLPIGIFGASTGAGAALVASAERPERIAAVVSRGGRPDLAGEALRRVRTPTLLVVGGHDESVIEVNEAAMARMQAPVKLEIVPKATHLFEEPGALEEVARLAARWFLEHLARVGQRTVDRRDDRHAGEAGAPATG